MKLSPVVKELERTLGPIAVVAISISAMLGSGIFVLPGLAAAKTGPSVWAAYLMAGLCVLPAAACKTELATAMPMSGGTYVYLDRIFGPLVGTISGVALWLSMLLKSAFALVGFGTYLAVLGAVPLVPTAMVLLAAIVALNVVGIQSVGKAQVAIVGSSLAALLGVVAFGVGDMRRANLENELAHGVGGFLAAMSFVFVSYNGVAKVAAIAEEVKRPEKTLPLGILTSLGIVMVLYGGVTFALVAVVPHTELATDLRPIHTLAVRIGGNGLGIVMAVFAVLTMTSMANAGLLASSRFPFAMSRDALLPPLLSQVSRRWGTPVPAIVMTGAAMAIALVLLDVEALAKLASALVIMLFVSETVAVVFFRESGVHWYRPTYRSPWYPWLHAFGVLSGIGLLFMLGLSPIVGALLTIVLGLVLFVLYGRKRAERLGVVGQRSRRADLLKLSPDDPAEPGVVGDAAVVVALFGKERSPEVLVELGGALGAGQRVQVMHVTEIPEQAPLEAALDEDVALTSLRRRVSALAEERNLDLEFHAVVSRDIVRTVHDLSGRVHCDWVVMEWRGRERDTLLPYNPIGWFINNLDANLALFADAGIRYVRAILVWAKPGPHDALVVGTADHLARLWKAELTLVSWVPDGAPAEMLQAEVDYLGQLRQLVQAPAKEHIARGRDRVAALTALTGAHDLLVMGAPDLTLMGMLRGTAHDRIKALSACSVLTLRTPRRRTHTAFAATHVDVPEESNLADFLEPGTLGARLEASRKEALFSHFADVFHARLPDIPARRISEALWERERTQNTSVGHGVALPHATIAESPRSLLGVFTTKSPVDWAGPDDQRVDVFFVTLCPPSARQTHLVLLSRIAALTLKTDLLDRLRSAETAGEMQRAVEECTAALAAESESAA